MTSNLEYITKCRVPGCTKEFVSTPFDIPIIGQPNARVVKFIMALAEHLEKKHPQMIENIDGASKEYTGFLIVSLFEVNDPKLLEMRENIRATIAKVSRRFQISDADIQDRVARMELDSEDEEGLNVLLRDMRDLLTEQGGYAPQNGQPAQKPLVTV
jgi:hypothetical protein